MKEAGQILAMVLDRIANIYERPRMWAPGADGVDCLLRHLHVLWLEGMGLDLGPFHSAIGEDVDGEPCQSADFSTHYRLNRDGGAEADDAEVIRFVVRCWRKVDAELGITLPPPFGGEARPGTWSVGWRVGTRPTTEGTQP